MHIDAAHYGLAALVVLGVNLLPAFAPPTWAVLVVCAVTFGLHPLWLVPIAALMATVGRLILARASAHFGSHLSAKRQRSLDAIRGRLSGHRHSSIAFVGLFLLSPLPSNQLFVAAGLMKLPLLRLGAAFLVGRLITYSLYVNGAVLAKRSFGDVFAEQWHSPLAIAIQIATVASLSLLVLVDWEKILGKPADATALTSKSTTVR